MPRFDKGSLAEKFQKYYANGIDIFGLDLKRRVQRRDRDLSEKTKRRSRSGGNSRREKILRKLSLRERECKFYNLSVII